MFFGSNSALVQGWLLALSRPFRGFRLLPHGRESCEEKVSRAPNESFSDCVKFDVLRTTNPDKLDDLGLHLQDERVDRPRSRDKAVALGFAGCP
jgi:hypothetical protein